MKPEQYNKVPYDIIKKYGITLLILFGSYADGSSNHYSDLDLAFQSDELLYKEQELNLLEDLIQYYQKSELDLINLSKATPTLKLEVAKKGALIYGKEEEFLNFHLYAASSFADSRFLRLERENFLKRRLSEL